MNSQGLWNFLDESSFRQGLFEFEFQIQATLLGKELWNFLFQDGIVE